MVGLSLTCGEESLLPQTQSAIWHPGRKPETARQKGHIESAHIPRPHIYRRAQARKCSLMQSSRKGQQVLLSSSSCAAPTEPASPVESGECLATPFHAWSFLRGQTQSAIWHPGRRQSRALLRSLQDPPEPEAAACPSCQASRCHSFRIDQIFPIATFN